MLILVFNEPWKRSMVSISYELSVVVGDTDLAAFFHYTVPQIFPALPAILESVRDDGLNGLLRGAEFA
jgi:hypothetical protein